MKMLQVNISEMLFVPIEVVVTENVPATPENVRSQSQLLLHEKL
jgi:hypothetical protein